MFQYKGEVFKIMDVIWIGTYANEEYLRDLMQDRAYAQLAANRVQSYYLNELKKYVKSLDILSSLVTIPFPRAKKLTIKERIDIFENHSKIYNAGFINITYVSNAVQEITLLNLCKRVICQKSYNDLLIVVYAMRIPYLKVARYLKSKYKNAVIILIVPDLPQYMVLNKSFIRKMLTKMNISRLRKAIVCVDGFVLYTKSMADALDISRKPHIVIEGLCNPNDYKSDNQTLKKKGDQEKIICLYAGGLEPEYGVDILVQGFIMAGLKDTELHLYGSGSYVEQLLHMSNKIDSVKYLGLLTPDQVHTKMREADLLINPRPSNEEFTKYSCPSKIFEYLSSGTPVLMTKLKGVPEEYYDYVYTITDETGDGIADKLKEIFNIPCEQRRQLAVRAREFILQNKSTVNQVKRFYEFSKSVSAKCRKNIRYKRIK